MEADQSSKKIEDQDVDKHRREHFAQYLLLIIIFVFSVTIIWQLKNTNSKLLVITAFSLVYLLWGVWHHQEERNFTLSHFLEYLMISILIFLVLAFTFLPI